MLNVTERLRAATETAAARDAAIAASTVKSAFLANMSHEIRTPMNGVIGMTELLLAHTARQPAARVCRACRPSREHMMVLIDDMLDIAKIEAGRVTLEVDNAVRPARHDRGCVRSRKLSRSR